MDEIGREERRRDTLIERQTYRKTETQRDRHRDREGNGMES